MRKINYYKLEIAYDWPILLGKRFDFRVRESGGPEGTNAMIYIHGDTSEISACCRSEEVTKLMCEHCHQISRLELLVLMGITEETVRAELKMAREYVGTA